MAECWLAVYFEGLLLQFHAWSCGQGHIDAYQQSGDVFNALPPLALFDASSKQITAASPQAQAVGVHSGLSITTAQALLPTLQLTDASAVDRERLTQWLCQWHYDFSARIFPAILPPLANDKLPAELAIWPQQTLVLEIGSMLQLFGGLDDFIAAYQARLSQYGLIAHWALAQQPLPAAVLAHRTVSQPAATKQQVADVSAAAVSHSTYPLTQHRSSTPRQTRFSAGLTGTPDVHPEDLAAEHYSGSAHRVDKPLKATVAEPAAAYQTAANTAIAHEFPASFPISALPLTAKTCQRLQGMGIQTWQQLQQLPRAELGKRFGQTLLTLLLQLEGRLSCQRQAYELPLQFQLQVLLPHDVVFIQGLSFPLAPMLSQLADYLRSRQLAVRQLSLTLRYRERDLPPLTLTIDYPMGEMRADGLLQLCRLQLERLTLVSPVTEIHLMAQHFVEPEIATAVLAGEQTVKQPLPQLLAKLQARLGHERVRYLTAAPHPLPERASSSLSIRQWPPQKHSNVELMPAFRPLWLLAEPELIARDEVKLLRGPERVNFCWADTAYPQRDYYVARHQSGRYCWVFRYQAQLLLHGWMA